MQTLQDRPEYEDFPFDFIPKRATPRPNDETRRMDKMAVGTLVYNRDTRLTVCAPFYLTPCTHRLHRAGLRGCSGFAVLPDMDGVWQSTVHGEYWMRCLALHA